MGRMLMTFIAVLMPILFMHVQNFPKFDDFIKNGTDTSLPVSMIVNTCSIFGSVVGFGRPYSVIVVSLLGFFGLLFLNKTYTGLADWADKFLCIALALVVNLEGMYVYVRHLIESDNRNEQKKILIFSFILFFLVFCFICVRL